MLLSYGQSGMFGRVLLRLRLQGQMGNFNSGSFPTSSAPGQDRNGLLVLVPLLINERESSEYTSGKACICHERTLATPAVNQNQLQIPGLNLFVPWNFAVEE